MKILVIDDNAAHRKAAYQTLGEEHELTVVGSHDEAVELVREKPCDREKLLRLKAEAEAAGYGWCGEVWAKAMEECKLPYWDAVLSDLLMPAGRKTQGGNGLQYVGTEMPIGWALAIDAALEGAKFVAVVTDMDHHSHPASAMLDLMDRGVFPVAGAKALFTNHIKRVGITGTEGPCRECGGTGKQRRADDSAYDCYTCHATGVDYAEKGKDWKDILDRLTSGEQEE